MFKELNTMSFFFDEPTKEFHVREAARLLKLAPATVSANFKSLEKIGLLKQRKDQIFMLYKANLESDFYCDLKRFYNVRKIKDSGLIAELNKFYLKPTIVLFGSFASGLDTEESDIDLLIISEKNKAFEKQDEFEKNLKRRIQLFVVQDIKDLKNKHLVNNILNGLVLQGGIRWI